MFDIKLANSRQYTWFEPAWEGLHYTEKERRRRRHYHQLDEDTSSDESLSDELRRRATMSPFFFKKKRDIDVNVAVARCEAQRGPGINPNDPRFRA